jgi:ribosomal protein S18 acetylase RimI-like enzyme
MFASVELAARIDHAEARLSEALGRAAIAGERGEGAFLEKLGGGVAVYAGPSSPMNKVIGVGFGALPGEEELAAIERAYRARSAAVQAEVSTMAQPAFAATLTRRGYVLEGFENVLGRPLRESDQDAARPGPTTITVMAKGEAERWLDAAVEGFLQGDEQGAQPPPLPAREQLKTVLRDFTDVAGFVRYCAWIDGELAGVASLRLDDGVAQLCGAATLPAFRRRGVQSALLQRRLADARGAGCDVAVMTTQPGSKSHENGHRQGFGVLYARAVLVLGGQSGL